MVDWIEMSSKHLNCIHWSEIENNNEKWDSRIISFKKSNLMIINFNTLLKYWSENKIQGLLHEMEHRKVV